jgi:hypothetical protein
VAQRASAGRPPVTITRSPSATCRARALPAPPPR